MDDSLGRRVRAAFAVASALVLAVGLAAPSAAAESVRHRGVPPDVGRTTGMRGPCYGGGKMSISVAQPSGGGLSVHIATQGVRDGSRWTGFVSVADLDGLVPDQGAVTAPTRAVGGEFTIDLDFDSVARPSVRVSLSTPRGEACESTVDTTTRATATCHGGIVISLFVVQKTGPDRLVMVFQLHDAHPGSKWGNEGTIRLPHDTEGWGSWPNKANADGLVEARLTWINPPMPNRSVSTYFDNPRGGQHCSIQLGTHRLATT